MLKLPQTLTQSSATVCLLTLTELLPAEATAFVVDAAELRHFDSSALAVLLALRREAFKLGKSFAIVSLPTRLGDLARLYGIAELLVSQAYEPRQSI